MISLIIVVLIIVIDMMTRPGYYILKLKGHHQATQYQFQVSVDVYKPRA